MQVGDALVRVHHRKLGARVVGCLDVGFERGALGVGKLAELRVKVAKAVIGIEADLLQRRAVLRENILEENRDRMAEHDRVGHLHHGRLEVQRQQHALRLGVRDLGGQELAKRARAHSGCVDHLAGLVGGLLLQNRGRAVVAQELDAEASGLVHSDGLFAAVEVAGAHMRNMGFRVRAPGAHLVRVLAGVLLHRRRGAAVGVALAQDRVHGAAEHFRIARLDVLLGVGLCLLGIIWNGVALALKLLDRGLQLRDGGADVRQLDDVGFRLRREFAEEREVVGLALRRGEAFRETRDDTARERDVPRLDVDAGGAGEGLHNGQERIGRERWGFIDLCPENLRRLGHASNLENVTVSSSASAS